MADRIKYPIFIVPKGRWDIGYTAKFLLRDEIDFKIVIEPQEKDQHSQAFGLEKLLILPFSNLGLGSIPARNWIWEYSKAMGDKRHWILDDNIDGMVRWVDKKRINCHSKEGFSALEVFVDRYKNIGIAGINYAMFGFSSNKLPPFYLNSRAYSCLLITNEIPERWRGRYNEDTDLCLQILMSGKCSVNLNVFLMRKRATMTCKGGNSEELYKGNGRLKMARSLESAWAQYPGLVRTIRKHGRPQHHVNWKRFASNKLIPV